MIKLDTDTQVLTVGKDFNILRGSISLHRYNRKTRVINYTQLLGYTIERIIIDATVLQDFMESQLWSYVQHSCVNWCTTEIISDKLYFPKLKKLKFV